MSRATINRILVRAGAVVPQPAKRPRSSYVRFEADQPNETWQSDFTHYRLTNPDGTLGGPGVEVEIISWLDDHSRYALHITAHARITGPIVVATFRQTIALHGIPASTLTDNGMVYTTRLSGGHVDEAAATPSRSNSDDSTSSRRTPARTTRPPAAVGNEVERFQQTMKKWLRAQALQPTTIAELQTLLEKFLDHYNQHRPHRSLPHQATPATAYASRPKATPATSGTDRSSDTHDRVRNDRVDDTGVVTLRVHGRLHHIGIGRTHARTHVLMLSRPPGPTPKPKNG